MLPIVLAAMLVPAAEFKMNLSLPLSDDAQILVQTHGDKFKKFSTEEFRKIAKKLVADGYELKDIKTRGLRVIRLKFHLPEKEEEKKEEKKPMLDARF